MTALFGSGVIKPIACVHEVSKTARICQHPYIGAAEIQKATMSHHSG
jgi:hypothetical protein